MPQETHQDLIKQLYPSINEERLDAVANALCPFKVKLPASLEETTHSVCSDFLSLKKESTKEMTDDWEDSVLNSLDFHYSDQKLKIIEANTNASGYLISHLINQKASDIEMFENVLFDSFMKKFGTDCKKVFIADAKPEKEKMFAEFLMYKDFFERKGIEAEIIETSKIKNHLDSKVYVYNRDTDFYLENHPELLAAWKEGKLILTSSPLSYENIAAKAINIKEQELLDNEKYLNLKPFFLETLNFDKELWSKRKSYFFKPSSSFGSKGVYSGKSISRKKFDGLGEDGNQDYLAQEMHIPGKVDHDGTAWKYDIRAYFSEGSVQKILARVYQGQLTNFSQAGGGFALIEWIR